MPEFSLLGDLLGRLPRKWCRKSE